jgi:hypothetical protein
MYFSTFLYYNKHIHMQWRIYRGAGAVVRPPPPFGVIRGAVVGVWLEFLPGSKEGSGKM